MLIFEDEIVMYLIMVWEKFIEVRFEEVLMVYKADILLGMIREENDFCILVVGVQEKIVLFRIGNDWCILKGIMLMMYIIKLLIGEIRQFNVMFDFS